MVAKPEKNPFIKVVLTKGMNDTYGSFGGTATGVNGLGLATAFGRWTT